MSKRPVHDLDSGARWRLDEIVLAAAALQGDQRAAYLRQLTSDHPELVERARRLLAAAAAVSESFLASPAVEVLGEAPPAAPAAPAVESAAAPVAPERRYVIGTLLGAGGMAEVYQAHDQQLDRPVALKLLSHGGAATWARCLQEARAQARVRHDNVLEVYETGELDGRPFIALRRVDGPTLEEIGQKMSLEQQVKLLIQASEGLHAAHLNGLVHRDVKPSNVLVEDTGEGELKAWVSDFGIAAAAAADPDEGDSLSGTMAYLAPERLDPASPPDRRGDVWSLGVTMYRLFTGVLPFDDERVLELLRKIRRDRPRRPRELVPALPADVEAIVLKCLAKDPAERYPTAADLAADLRRFLNGEAVLAHASGLAYRATRFAARHRGWVAFAAVAATVLALALAVAAALGVQAMQANRQVALRQAQAEELISFMILDLRDKLDQLGRLELIDEVGERALRYFAAVPEAELSDDELARHSTALHQIGDVRMRQGDLAEAARVFGDSLALAQALVDRDPSNNQRLFDLGQSHFWVGYAERELGRLDRAERSFTSYLELCERLVARDGEDPRWRLELSYAHSNLGTLLQDRGDFEGARSRFELSLASKQELARQRPDDLALRHDLGWSHNTLGVVLDVLDPAAARHHFERDLEIKTSLVAAEPDNVTWRDDLGVAHNYLGLWLLHHGRWRRAETLLRAAVELHEALVADDPANAAREKRLAYNLTALGRVLAALGKVDGSLAKLRRAEEILERHAIGEPAETVRIELAKVRIHQALAFQRLGRGQRVHQYLRAAIDVSEKLASGEPAARLAHQHLGKSLIVLGDQRLAEGAQRPARESWRRAAQLIEPFARQVGDHGSLALLAQARLRLGERATAAQIIARLQAAGVCMPTYEELCAPGVAGRARGSE